MRLKKGSLHPVTIEKIVFQGWGLGTINGVKVFVPHSLPGDQITVEIQRRQKKYLMAKKVETHTPSTYRDASQCTHFPRCGGCQLIDVDYTKQLALKEMILHDCFEGQFPELKSKLADIIPSPNSQYYRNKMEFAFGQENDRIFLGLKERGKFDTIVPITKCQLLSEESNRILEFCNDYFSDGTWTAWDYHTHTGILRHLMLRHSKGKDQYMLNLILSEDLPLEPFFNKLCQKFPNIVSCYKTVNDTIGDNTHGLSPTLVQGVEQLSETLNGQDFLISPLSFFQTNTKGAELLYTAVKDMAKPKKSDTVLDLYCGTGTIGLSLAPHVQHVTGIDENSSAIANAWKNAELNGIQNATFREGRVKNILKFESFSPDIVIVDPPRSGLVPKALRRAAALEAPTLIYVSCNPTTLCRDLHDFVEHGYTVESMMGVDMFPNTYHIETVTRLTRT